jgi:formylglycine-generating enzyme required for sulfatase activity
MHGNVWEWCKDYPRDYEKADEAIVDPGFVAWSVSDPVDTQGENSQRALRGGSWFSYARFALAACRFARPPERRLHYLGLRFVLRSTRQD